MQPRRRNLHVLLLLLALLLVVPLALQASSGGPYEIDWFTIDAGGTMSVTGGSFQLQGTAGQPDTGSAAAGPYALQGGFWAPAAAGQLFLPLITS